MESLQEKGKYAMNHDEQAPVTTSSCVSKPQSAAQKNETTHTICTTDGIACKNRWWWFLGSIWLILYIILMEVKKNNIIEVNYTQKIEKRWKKTWSKIYVCTN